jgi:hypothetical protein
MIVEVKDVEKFLEMLENEEIQIVPKTLTDEDRREISEFIRQKRLSNEQKND